MSLSVSSAAFGAGAPIPKKYAYTGEGDNVSPPLAWTGAPANTKSFALICDDPDAPSPKKPRPDPWVHWVLFDIPAQRTSLAAGEAGVGVAGRNDFGKLGWGGPLPPPGSGKHRYFFHLYALDAVLQLKEPPSKKQLLEAIKGHVLAQGEIYGTYERK